MNLLTYEEGDRILIVGDFNIHVCCETGPLVKYFLTLINTFNLTQWVRKPTHIKGHMLDLVLSNGLVISITDIKDSGISDNFPVMFDVSVCNVETTAHFPAAFINSVLCYANSNNDLSVDELTNLLISACSSILDTVAPLRTKRTKLLHQP